MADGPRSWRDHHPTVLLYDWDNTLVDGWAAIAAALNAAFDAFDLPRWTRGRHQGRVRTSLRESFPAMFGARWEEAPRHVLRHLSEQHLAIVRPMPGAARGAAGRGRAGRRAVVSNKSGKFLRAEVAHLGWDGHFQRRDRRRRRRGGQAGPRRQFSGPCTLTARRSTVWYWAIPRCDMQAARAAGVTAVLVGDAAHDGGIERRRPISMCPLCPWIWRTARLSLTMEPLCRLIRCPAVVPRPPVAERPEPTQQQQ